jgi:hypothetical protein
MATRRDFLKGCGALIVSFGALPSLDPMLAGQGPFATHESHIDPKQLDSWLALNADGTITAHTGKCDFGQGIFTAQAQLVAEELCVPIARVKLIQCDTDVTPDQGTTSGSQSTPTNFNDEGLGLAAATAREALLAYGGGWCDHGQEFTPHYLPRVDWQQTLPSSHERKCEAEIAR